MKKILNSAIFSLLATMLFAQPVPRTIIVEHFTNTLCTACASRNPGFIANVNANAGVLHIAYHPSAPYAGCTTNQYNKDGNDTRTRYYNIFGSTPRIVVQGVAVPPSTNYSQSSIFDAYRGQTSAVSMKITASQTTTSIVAEMEITAEDNNILGVGNLYVALVQDQYDFASPNGEKVHYNVFRHALLGNSGQPIQIPSDKGGKTTVQITLTLSDLRFGDGKISVVAILNNSDKSVEQSARAGIALSTSINTPNELQTIKIYPNPAVNFIRADLPTPYADDLLSITDLHGKVLKTFSAIDINNGLDISDLNAGLYFLSGKGYKPTIFIKN